MKIEYHVKGIARKRLALTIGELTHTEVSYRGSPGYEYDIGLYTVNQNGALILPDSTDNSRLLRQLSDAGYINGIDSMQATAVADAKPSKGTISYPRCDFTPQSMENLRLLVASKATLIAKALGAASLPIEVHSDSVRFPWLPETVDDKTAKAVAHFISALCEMARTQKTIRAVEHTVENEKYTFRCFLIRLGFVGNAYRGERKVLLSKLSGSAAYKECKK